MLLCVDIGNSSIKFGVFDQDKLTTKFSIPTKRDYTPATLSEEIGDRLPPDIDQAIICSVVPELDHAVTDHLSHFLHVQPRFVSQTDDFGFTVNFPLTTTGTDRLVNASAAARKYGVPVIVVSLGTATTIDVVNSRREYIGGLIAPGIKVSAKALSLATSKLPEVEISKPEKAIGQTTETAIRSGLFYGHSSMIDGLLKRVAGELGEKPKVIATGGLAQLLAPDISLVNVIDEDLTLEGLMMIAADPEESANPIP